MLAQPIRDNLLACILVVLVAVMASELLGAASAGTWTWKGLTPLQGPAPEPRRHGVTIYDPVGKRVILFGGQGESGLLNDLWAFDLTSPAWSLLDDSGTAPAPRRGHNAIYDPVGHQMIVWAGQQGSLFFNDTWALNLTTLQWEETSPSVRPAPRYGSASIFDPVEGRLVQFAGFTDSGRFQDTQAFDLTTLTWQDLTPTGISPLVRCLHTAAFDPTTGRMIVYGGQRTGPLGDLWAFDLGTDSWTELTPSDGPSGRYFATSFVDGEGSFIVFGGVTTSGNVNQTWSYCSQTGQWTQLSLESPPAARNGMMGAYVAEEDRFIVFGGVGTIVYNDIWELSAIAAPTTEFYFAQFANGAEFVSSLVLTNPSQATEVTGTVRFFDDLGEPLSVSLNGQSAASEFSFSIPLLGSVTFTSDGQGDLVSGSVAVTADSSIGGVLGFTFPERGIAGVGASVATSGFIIPVARSVARSFSTGVALAAQASAPSLSLTLRNQGGEPVAEGQAVIDLPANGHLARFIEELFPNADTAEFEGTLTVSAEGGTVAGTAIELGSQPGEFTVLPVTPLE